MESIVIDSRFCGPPKSANGGYTCGLLAAHIEDDAEITLLAPPPLGEPLDLAADGGGPELTKDARRWRVGAASVSRAPKFPR